MNPNLSVLLVEDRDDDELLIRRVLAKAGYVATFRRVQTEAEMKQALTEDKFDVILSDFVLPEFSCPRALATLRESGLDIPLIALSGTAKEEVILDLVRAGARDYVMKDNLTRLPSVIKRERIEAESRKSRKRLEQQLLQAQKMEAIGRLAAGVAHDFNNLLTVITGFAQLALLDDNPARSGLEQIMQAAERATGLTRQLLAFSRQQALEPRIFDMNQLVRDIEKMLRRLIGEDIDVTSNLKRERLAVKADPGQIEQVLLNLAVNSRDAMPQGGKLILTSGVRYVDESMAKPDNLVPGEYFFISVSDNGKGIPADILPQIFEPFFTTKPVGQGTGLGLSTAYGIVQQSGGAIHAYSEPNIGTTMTVLLPSVAEGAITRNVLAAEPVPHGSETVLVAEDDKDVLNMVAATLSLRGFEVLRAGNGKNALEILSGPKGKNVDLLITDIVMPVLNGPQLADQASSLFPRLKILFMSGYTEDVIQHHGMHGGGSGFIQKPFAPGNLVRKVRELIDGKKTLTA